VAAELARLSAAVEALATRVVEIGADITELQSSARRRKASPPGLVALKTAVDATGFSYEHCRRLCVKCGDAVGAVRCGGFWFVDAAALLAKIRTGGR
jgi:hypothetical protein